MLCSDVSVCVVCCVCSGSQVWSQAKVLRHGQWHTFTYRRVHTTRCDWSNYPHGHVTLTSCKRAQSGPKKKSRAVVAFFLSCFCVLCLTTSMPLARACGAFAFWFDSVVVVVQAQPSVLASKHVSGASSRVVAAGAPRTNFCCVFVCLRSTVARQVLAQSSHPSKRARSNTCDCHDRRQRWQRCARRPQ